MIDGNDKEKNVVGASGSTQPSALIDENDTEDIIVDTGSTQPLTRHNPAMDMNDRSTGKFIISISFRNK